MLFHLPRSPFQVGGSLPPTATTYIEREADAVLLQALREGQFCYVFNARQMGKSSLRVRTMARLQQAGIQCLAIDLTSIGSRCVSGDQWYAAIASCLVKGLQLSISLRDWWRQREHLPVVWRLAELIDTVLLVEVPQRVVILVDEIDSILGLQFPTDDFFALIRTCLNRRAESPQYQRLTFALFGVTTPDELIADKQRTPFNIGQAIALQGFTRSEAQPLADGLRAATEPADVVLQRILDWTGGQPFLTQKLCQQVVTLDSQSAIALARSPADQVDALVVQTLLTHWEVQDEPTHLRTIRDRLLMDEQRSPRLLGLYQQILQQQGIPLAASVDQTALLLSGLVCKRDGQLQVKNRIYRTIFDHDWIQTQLAQLRPYSVMLQGWLASGKTDTSWLLRGRALHEAQVWSQNKSLSDTDYQFLQASQLASQQALQQSLEAARLRETNARLLEERKAARLKSVLLGVVSLGFIGTLGLSLLAGMQYYTAKLSEVKALASSSQGQFASDQQLNALVAAIKAQHILDRYRFRDQQTRRQVAQVLNQAVFGSNEVNRLVGHQGALLGMDISPDGQFFATSSNDKMVKLWSRDGQLQHSFIHDSTVLSVAFNPDSQQVATGSLNGQVKIWNLDGTLVQTVQAHAGPIWSIVFSADAQPLMATGGNQTITLRQPDGTLVQTLPIAAPTYGLNFSPDGQTLAAAMLDGTVQLWSRQGELQQVLTGHQGGVWNVAFCPPNPNVAAPPSEYRLVSVSADQTAKIWSTSGKLLQTLHTAETGLRGVDCSHDGRYVATAGQDNQIHIWTVDGDFIRTLKGHQSAIRKVKFSPDAAELASIGHDGIVKIWRRNRDFLEFLHGPEDTIWSIATSPHDHQMVAASGFVNQLILWKDLEPQLELRDTPKANLFSVAFFPDQPLLVGGGRANIRLLRLEQAGEQPRWTQVWERAIPTRGDIQSVAVSPDGQTILAGSDEGKIGIWNPQGDLLDRLETGNDRIWQMDFQPRSASTPLREAPLFVLAAANGAVELWRLDGTKVATLKERGTAANWGAVFSPDGQTVAAASYDGKLRLWQVDGTLLFESAGSDRGLTRVAFSPDGQTIATGGLNSAVKLWNLDGTLQNTLAGHESYITSLAYSQDGQYLFSGAADGQLIAWKLDAITALDPLEYACNWVRDYLQTNAEVDAGDRQLCPQQPD